MANINLGPAQTQTANTEAVLAPQVTPNFGNLGNGLNALRLLAVTRAVSVAGTGDIAVMPVINSLSFVVQSILIGNAQGGSAATANFTINSGAAVTGTNFRAAGVLTGVTGPTTMVPQTAASTSVLVTGSPNIYVNNTVAVAGVTVDVFFYGYDCT
jgi:hypothetical protein